MSLNYRNRTHSIASQTVARFTGEGAYHGSTKPRPRAAKPAAATVLVDEVRPRTIERYVANGQREIGTFCARFANRCDVLAQLPVPTQAQVQGESVTFCWCPYATAVRLAGPLTKRVLEAMSPFLNGEKAYTYIDTKVQYFEPGDLPVDSQLWHVDGSIAVRDQRAVDLGHSLLHDMRARVHGGSSPTYLSYQSSHHCATRFVAQPLSIQLPELIPNFDGLDQAVRQHRPTVMSQSAASIVGFDGLSLHRATPATAAGWRLWVRCIETDRRVELNSSIIDCYGTVFRPS